MLPNMVKFAKIASPMNRRPLSFLLITSRSFPVLATGLCWIALGLSACVSPNMRYVGIGCVSARAHLRKNVRPLYHEVEITRPTSTAAPRLRFRLPGGQILEQTALTCDGLRRAGFEEKPDDFPRQYYDPKLGTSFKVSHLFRGHGATFLFIDDTLVVVSFQMCGVEGIGIGREDAKEFYSLPLTQEDLEHVFGHPDRIVDGHYW
jgi:hypothetical protein